MDNIGILHISDTHICSKNEKIIQKTITSLLKDLDNICTINSIDIDFICFTGDLINQGANSEKEFDMALSSIVIPLITHLNLSEKDFYFVPGNHEVNVGIIDEYLETGLSDKLNSVDAINHFFESKEYKKCIRLSHVDDFLSNLNKDDAVLDNGFFSSYKKTYKGLNIGIACMNSAWRSTGSGASESGKLVLGKNQVIDCYESIEDADFTIGMFHHPTDWLVTPDRFEVNKFLNRFDMILNGHIHSLDSQYILGYNGKTLFNTTGRLCKSEDFFNGYSIITLNPLTTDSKIYLRHYFPDPRNSFDAAVNLTENGILEERLNPKNASLALACDICYSIIRKFNEYITSFLIPNILENADRSFDEIFVEPCISYSSEQKKEIANEAADNIDKKEIDTIEEIYIDVDTIISSKKNYIIHGKKESGKTTLAHYISKKYLDNFKTFKKIPVLIRINEKLINENKIIMEILTFLREFIEDDSSINRNNIIELLENGYIALFLEDSSTEDFTINSIVKSFIEKYDKNIFYFTCVEDITYHIESITHEIFDGFDKIFIQSLNKTQIRQLTERWTGIFDEFETTQIIDKLVNYLKNSNLPKTPFNISLILSIFKTDKQFVPINEAIVIENFLQTLLEKISKKESYSSTYDYTIKESFLIELALSMTNKDTYYFTESEFTQIIEEYHSRKGFVIEETNFDTLFFDKGILIRYYGKVAFRYPCLIEFCLAKFASKNESFLKYILASENYMKFCNELNYYTGLNREDKKTISIILQHFQKLFAANEKNYDESLDIGVSLSLKSEFDVDIFKKELESKVLSIEETDKITDFDDTNSCYNPDNHKKENKEDAIECLLETLFIYGNAIKNSELLDYDIKLENFKIYIDGALFTLNILMKDLLDFFSEDTSKIELSEENSKEIEEINQLIDNLMKITLPILFQNMIYDNIGTAKLQKIILNEIDSIKDNNSFHKFLLICIYCDLRLTDYTKILPSYVKSVTSKEILNILIFKLYYYYMFRYFGNRYSSILSNLITEIAIKLKKVSKEQKPLFITNLKNLRLSFKQLQD